MNGRKLKGYALTATVTLAFMIFVAGLLWYTSGSLTPRQATWENVLKEAERGGYRIIKVEELWDQYQKRREDLLLVDTRQEWEYRTGHIKDSVSFPIEPTWLSRWQKKSALQELLGPEKNRIIVFY